MTNQPWQEKLNDILPDAYGLQSVTGHNERRAIFEQLEQFISELSKEQFTAGYKAGRDGRNKEVLDLIERVIQEERFAGAPYALNKIKELINKDEK